MSKIVRPVKIVCLLPDSIFKFFLACSFIFLTQDPLNIYEQTVRPVEALWCVGLVLLNALRVIWKRFIKKLSIFSSDREHIHHYFLDQGFSNHQTLLIVCFISFSISAFGFLLFFLNTPEWLSLLIFISILIIWSWIGKFSNQKTKIQESLQSSK